MVSLGLPGLPYPAVYVCEIKQEIVIAVALATSAPMCFRMPLLAQIVNSFDGRHPLVRDVFRVVPPKGGLHRLQAYVWQPFQKRIVDERLGFLPLH